MCTWIQMMIFCGEGGDRGAGVSFTAILSQKGNVREDNWHQLLPKLCFLWKHPPPHKQWRAQDFKGGTGGGWGRATSNYPDCLPELLLCLGQRWMKDSIKERDRIGVIEADPTKGVGGRGPPTRKKMKLKVKWCISKICLKPQPNMSFKNGSNK